MRSLGLVGLSVGAASAAGGVAILISSQMPAGAAANEAIALVALGTMVLLMGSLVARAGANRRAEQDFHLAVFALSDDACISFDRSLRILDANSRAKELLGYSEDELVGLNLSGLISPSDLDALGGASAELLQGKTDHRVLQVEIENRDGSKAPVEVNLRTSPRKRFLLASFKDTSREAERQRATARLASLVEHTDDAILATDSAGIITDWNTAAQSLFGYTASEAIGRSVAVLTPPGRAGVLPDVITSASGPGRAHRYETAVLCKDDSQAFVALTISPVFDVNGHVSGASLVAKDMTLRRRAEDAIHTAFIKERVHAEQEREAAQHFKKLDLLKDEFLSTVAHEIKTPLVLVIGFAETLVAHWNRMDDDTRDHLLKKISYHTREGSRMVEQLLDLTRLEAGIQIHLTTVSLSDALT